MQIDSRYNGGFEHDEADVTMIAYLLQAAESEKSVIRILTDDTDVFVLLVHWVWKMELHSAVQMERWNGVVININATWLLLGCKCLQLPVMHAISGCDTVSFPFNEGKISALNIPKAGEFTALYEVLGEENATDAELMETGRRFFTAMYGQPEGTTISLHQEERETTPDNGDTTYRSKSAASHEKSSPAGDFVESSRSARSSHFGHHQVRKGHEERASITFANVINVCLTQVAECHIILSR